MAGSAERGRWVGRYELLERLPGGSVTDLYLARFIDAAGMAHVVALKQLRPEARRNATATKQFIDDVRRGASLVHPNVGRVLEAGVDAARLDPYVALEFIAGQDLAALMEAVARNGLQLPLPVAARIVHDACLGLHAAHVLADASGKRLGIVHGALTPRNVLITYEGHTQVVDFGVAGARRSLRVAFPGQLFGTLAYLSPEQVLEHPVDARTDVFAAATILFELLTGRRMHANDAAAPRAVVIEHPPAPSTLAGDITPQLDALVLGGLEKNADDRPASALAFARALAAAVPLADEQEVAALMRALFETQRRATEALVDRSSADEQEEKTVSMAIPTGAGQDDDEPAEVTSTEGAALPLSEESPEATQQMTAIAPPSPSTSREAGRRSPQRAAPNASPRPPPPAADLWAPPPPPADLWAPPPPPAAQQWAAPPGPAAGSRAPSSAPPAPAMELWAPPPEPAAVSRAPSSAPPAPAMELWAPRAPAPPPPAPNLWAPPPPAAAATRAPEPAPRAPALSAPPPPSAAPAAPVKAEAAPAKPPEDDEGDAAPRHAPKEQTAWDRVRWPVALALLAIAIAAVAWFIQTKWLAPPEAPPAPEARNGARAPPGDSWWA